MTEDSFQDGFGFDGSSIRGFQQIQESDMLLIPDPTTAMDDLFRERKTLIIYCFVNDPVTGAPYDRDPRYVARKAEEYLRAPASPTPRYWGPEAEFYIFDDVRFGQNQSPASTSSTRSRAPGTRESTRRAATSATSPATRRATSRFPRPTISRISARR